MLIRRVSRTSALCSFAALSSLTLYAAFTPTPAAAQTEQSRVIWQLDYDDSLNQAQQNEVQAVVLQTLARAKERHFAGDTILTQKLKKEGLNFPECFTEGLPCTGGGAFVLDVHNVDAFANALFSYNNKEWTVSINLYQRLSSSAVQIKRSGPSLPELVQNVAGSLFELESGLQISSTIPDVDIYINQKLVGKTPMNMKTSVGDQSITFKKDGYVSETWNFTTEKGGIYTKVVDLRPEETQLTVLTTADDAVIFIDDTEWGKANETHNILPGDHHIEIRSESHRPFTQDYKLYPGTPQTIQAALLPNSRSPYDLRHDGIQKYRLSASLGYHFAAQNLRFGNAKLNHSKFNFDETAYFNGISLALNYENDYWGVQFLRLDVGGSNMNSSFDAGNDSYKADSAMFLGLYPAQIKAHYLFWVMQAEASFGIGYALTKLKCHQGMTKKSISQNAFSLDFSLGIKFFFSEESFAMFSYDLQYDAAEKSKVRNGFTLGIGLQFPVWMRTNDAPDPDTYTEEQSDSEDQFNTQSDDLSSLPLNDSSASDYILPQDNSDDELPNNEEDSL